MSTLRLAETTPVSLAFFVAGIPKPSQTGSVIRAGDRLIPLRRNTPWGVLVGSIARQHAPATPLPGPLAMSLTFYLPRPKALPRHRTLPVVRPDLDNLVKHLCDQLEGVLYARDSQLVELILSKRYAERDGRCGLEVEVREVAG
jgi:Holliday junction resolvase RusA-like endonuclease